MSSEKRQVLKETMELYAYYKESYAQIKNVIDNHSRIELLKEQYDLLLLAFDHAHYAPDKLKSELWVRDEAIKFVLPPIEKLLINHKDLTNKQYEVVYDLWEKVYALIARRSFHHFLIYMEQDRSYERRVYHRKRDVILKPFAYYFERMIYNDDFQFMTSSMPPSFGKSFLVNYATAWVYGLKKDSSVLRISVAEYNVMTASSNIKQILMDQRYGEVFPHFAELAKNKPDDIFSIHKAEAWKIQGADVEASHMAVPMGGQIEGKRANRLIIADDTLKQDDASNEKLMEENWQKWQSSIKARDDGESAKYLMIGTMWHPKDLIGRMIDDEIQDSEIIDGKFKYTQEVWRNDKLVGVIIRTPMLDYDTDETTCEFVMSTESARRRRRNTDEFLWSSAYQQRPIPPKGRLFEYEHLNQYDGYFKGVVNYKGAEVKMNEFAYMAIDPVRKGTDYMSAPIFKMTADEDNKHYLIDVIYKGKSMDEIYDVIIEKAIVHNINLIVLESNTGTNLKDVLEMKFKEKSKQLNKYIDVEIVEKYNTENKMKRILDASKSIRDHMVFPKQGLYPPNSEMGKFMQNVTSFSVDVRNNNDDAPDSLALYVAEIMRDKRKAVATVEVLDARSFWG